MKSPDNNYRAEPGTETPGSTSGTLLDRVKAGDEASRARLVALYEPLVYHRYLAKVPEHERPDIAQAVFATLFEKIGQFEKRFDGPAFRGWLYKISFNKVGDYIRRTRRKGHSLGEASIAAESGIPVRREGGDDATERNIIFRKALELARAEFEPETFQAALRLIEGESGAMVAADTNKTCNAIYIAKSRVLRRVRDILEEFGELTD